MKPRSIPTMISMPKVILFEDDDVVEFDALFDVRAHVSFIL